MLVTEWQGKISGISYRSDDCDVSTLQKRFVLRLVGRVPVVIWESGTAYSMWMIMISALITFSIQKLRLLLNRWAPSRKMVLCSSQWWCRCNLSGTIYWSAPLDNRVICFCSAGMRISLMEVMVVWTNSEIYQVVCGQCTENGTWWWNQRIKKATKADKDAFMKWQRSR